MKNLIESRLKEMGKTVEWLAKEIGMNEYNLRVVFNGNYETTLREAVVIANTLETDIWTIFPELPPSRKRFTQKDYDIDKEFFGEEIATLIKTAYEQKYSDLSEEVDKRLREEVTGEQMQPEYRILTDEDIFQKKDEFTFGTNEDESSNCWLQIPYDDIVMGEKVQVIIERERSRMNPVRFRRRAIQKATGTTQKEK